MKSLATIYSSNKIKQLPVYVENINNFDGIGFDTLPQHKVLLVGYDFAKKTLPGFSILNKTPFPDRFWTFGRTERRYEYDRDLEAFLSSIIKDEAVKIKYSFISITKITPACFTRLLFKMKNNKAVVYETSHLVYMIVDSIHNPYNVMSFSKDELDYCDYNKPRLDKILSLTGACMLPERTKYDVDELYQQTIDDRFVPYFWLLSKQ